MTLRPQILVFDFDGTLIPTMEGFARIAAQVIHEQHGWSLERASQAYLNTSGIPFFQQLEVLFPAHEKNSVLADQFEQRKKQFIETVPIETKVKEALILLKESGHRLVISSNNFDELVQSVVQRQIPGLFHLVCGYKPGFAKGKEHFKFIQSELDAPPEDMIFIGDSLSDFAKAQAARIPFIGVLGTFTVKAFQELNPHLALISSVAELPLHLKKNKINLQLAEI